MIQDKVKKMYKCQSCQHEFPRGTVYNRITMGTNKSFKFRYCPKCNAEVSVEKKIASLWIDINKSQPKDPMKMILAYDNDIRQPRLVLGEHLSCINATYWMDIPKLPF